MTYGHEIILTSGSQWSVPADWSNSVNEIDVIGGGGGGGNGTSETSGGGGAFSAVYSVKLTPGSAINYQVGTGGAGGALPRMTGTAITAMPVGRTAAIRGLAARAIARAWLPRRAARAVGPIAAPTRRAARPRPEFGALKYSGGKGTFTYTTGTSTRGGGGGGGPAWEWRGWGSRRLWRDRQPRHRAVLAAAPLTAARLEAPPAQTGGRRARRRQVTTLATAEALEEPRTRRTDSPGTNGGGGGGGYGWITTNVTGQGGRGGDGTEWGAAGAGGGGGSGGSSWTSQGGWVGADGGLYGGGGGAGVYAGTYGPNGPTSGGYGFPGGNGAQGVIVIEYGSSSTPTHPTPTPTPRHAHAHPDSPHLFRRRVATCSICRSPRTHGTATPSSPSASMASRSAGP